MDREHHIKDFLCSKLDPYSKNHQNAIARALTFLWQRQTNDEQRNKETRYLNRIGFTAADAKKAGLFFSALNRQGNLTPTQTAQVARMLVKYSRQLAEMPERTQ